MRSIWILVLLITAFGGFHYWKAPAVDPPTSDTRGKEGNPVLVRGVEYLLRMQEKDGGWRSQTYGQMKGGAATTALVVYTLSALPGELRAECEPAIRRGISFLKEGFERNGFISNPDGSWDYPNYATALTLTALCRMGWDLPEMPVQRLCTWLEEAQFDEEEGWTPRDPEYGGWDHVGGEVGVFRVSTGADLSVAVFVMEALAAARLSADSPVWMKARRFVLGCQDEQDGGFFFTPSPEALSNKAGFQEGERASPRPYGTMTCDGVRALLFCGFSRESSEVQAGLDWLCRHPGPDPVPGLEGEDAREWGKGLRFYYWVGIAPLLHRLPEREKDRSRQALYSTLSRLQRSDGSWANSSPVMREDDPLIATSLAVLAFRLAFER